MLPNLTETFFTCSAHQTVLLSLASGGSEHFLISHKQAPIRKMENINTKIILNDETSILTKDTCVYIVKICELLYKKSYSSKII